MRKKYKSNKAFYVDDLSANIQDSFVRPEPTVDEEMNGVSQT